MSLEAELANRDISKFEALEFLRGPNPQRLTRVTAPVPHPHGPNQSGMIWVKCQICHSYYEAKHGLGPRTCSDPCWWVAYDIDDARSNYWDSLDSEC